MGLHIIAYEIEEPEECQIHGGEPEYYVPRKEVTSFDSLRQDVDSKLPSGFEWKYNQFDNELRRPSDFAEAIKWVSENASNPERYLNILAKMEANENIWFKFAY